MPINKKYNIETFLNSVRLYFEVQRQPGTRHNRIRHAGSRQRRHRACARAGRAAERYAVQDQPDPSGTPSGAPYGRSSNSRIDRFSKVLMEYGFTTIVRKTRGDDIDAACGQLAGDVIDRTKRTLRKRMQGEAIDVKAV